MLKYVIDDRSRRMTSNEYKAILCSHSVKGWCFTMQMDNDTKDAAKATQVFLKGKKWNSLQLPSQWPDYNTTEHAFQFLTIKLKAERPSKIKSNWRPGKTCSGGKVRKCCC